jgi:hypothetical protein
LRPRDFGSGRTACLTFPLGELGVTLAYAEIPRLDIYWKDGAGSESRTRMTLRPRDFESRASTDSAIPADGPLSRSPK